MQTERSMLLEIETVVRRYSTEAPAVSARKRLNELLAQLKTQLRDIHKHQDEFIVATIPVTARIYLSGPDLSQLINIIRTTQVEAHSWRVVRALEFRISVEVGQFEPKQSSYSQKRIAGRSHVNVA